MVIDLSHPLNPATPTYPGDPPVAIKELLTIKEHGCAMHTVETGMHTGTHIDAPSHMIDGGVHIDAYPAERFVLKSICIDVAGGFSSAAIESIDDSVRAVLFYSGWDMYYGQEAYWSGYPLLDDGSIAALKDKGISLIGMDMASPDLDETFPIHKTLLGSDILIVENLTKLKKLVGKTFELHVAPLRLPIDGSPIRAYAVVNDIGEGE